MKLTKKTRHKFYIRMLEIYLRDIDIDYTYGICSCIHQIYDEGLSDDKWLTIQMFPELMKHQPISFFTYEGDDSSHDYQFWFPIKDTKSRIKILEEAIELTK